MSDVQDKQPQFARLYALLLLFALAAVGMVARAVNLQVVEKDFLQSQGAARFLREVEIPTMRGLISDRHGEPLAVSTPVESVWVNPPVVLEQVNAVASLAKVLGAPAEEMERRLLQRSEREFVWLRRRVSPTLAESIRELKLDGVYFQREYQRFYPSGEITSHVIGFTNVDDIGQEGLELAYNDWLKGVPGSKRVIRDLHGRIVEDVELVREARPGRELRLTIDRRLQYLAYRELKRAVQEHEADSGSVVLLDSTNGEVLAMVNQPAYNPNQRRQRMDDAMRNRAVTDVFEPGSIMKPFTLAAILESGRVTADTIVDTTPGRYEVSGHTIRDVRDYGEMTVTRIITKSSNVGMAKLALAQDGQHLWNMLSRFGFGEVTGAGFPGESPGVLRRYQRWRPLEQATLSYGYGLSVTPLQMAQAYASIADNGRLHRPRLVLDSEQTTESVLDPTLADTLTAMLETVTGDEGTASNAALPLYRVAGKTGTSRKVGAGGYHDRYVSSFAGFAPVSNPRLVCVVIINDPAGEAYYGGAVAAPVFAEVMSGALRLLNVPPDDLNVLMAQAADNVAPVTVSSEQTP
ncbi:MAG: penicillin-binding protein 2 [Wenzhouxiangellaceae bacterium]